jgi:hypothetical protein
MIQDLIGRQIVNLPIKISEQLSHSSLSKEGRSGVRTCPRQDKLDQEKAKQDRERQDRLDQEKAKQDKERQDRLDEEKATRDKERQDKLDAAADREAAMDKTLSAIVRIHFTCIKGSILQVLSDGVILTNCENWHGEHTPFRSDGEGLNHFMPVREKAGNCFVVCDTTGLTDGEQFWQPVGLNGTYSYRSVLGAKVTVKAYTSNLAEKAKNLSEYRVPDADIVAAVTKKLDLKRYSYSTKIAPPTNE